MPFENEHACRLSAPEGFQDDSFRRVSRDHDGKKYDVITGKLEGEEDMTEQSYRYPTDAWDEAAAKAHCGSHDGTFEAAAESESDDSEDDSEKAGDTHDSRDKRFVACGFKVATIDRDERTAIFSINSDHVDRDREVVLPGGAKLTAYRKNPVVLYGHNYDSLPIGKSLWVKKTKEEGRDILTAKVKFASTQFANEVFELVADGFLSTASIGFIPDDFRGRAATDDELKKYPDWANAERVYDKWDMLEWSVVPVPSNPHALARAVLDGKAKLPTGMTLAGLPDAGDSGAVTPEAWEVKTFVSSAHEATFKPVEAFQPDTFERHIETLDGRAVAVITGLEHDHKAQDRTVVKGERKAFKRFYATDDWAAKDAMPHAVDLGAIAFMDDCDRVNRIEPVEAKVDVGEVRRVQPVAPKVEPVRRITTSAEIRRIEEERARGRIVY